MPLRPLLPPPNKLKHPVLLLLLLLLLLPTPMWMPNRHHRPMQEKVEVSLPSRGLLACTRGGRFLVLPILACLIYVFDL